MSELKVTHYGKKKSGGDGVLNRAAASVQVTVEQILREALEQQGVVQVTKSVDKFADAEEVKMYKAKKREQFEHFASMARSRKRTRPFVQYAAWEESVGEMERARSVMERGIEANYTDPHIWLKYAEMEMRHGFVNSARNIFVRACSHLPRHDTFWFKFAAMEEMVGNVDGARTVFAKWMAWKPKPRAWVTYINFEKRYEEWDRVRAVFHLFTSTLEQDGQSSEAVKAWLKYASFEESLGDIARARGVFESGLGALDRLGIAADPKTGQSYYLAFAKFEERVKEFERARVIYQYAMTKIPSQFAKALETAALAFEKRHGTRTGIEAALITKQREEYDAALEADPADWDLWFEYVRLEEAHGDPGVIREVYERALGAAPADLLAMNVQDLSVAQTKSLESYAYLYINYALYEELTAGELARAASVYETALGVFAPGLAVVEKLYILGAGAHIRAKNLDRARKLLGHGLGRAPSAGLFDYYIQLEYDLLNFGAARSLYNKYLEFEPEAVDAWIKYAQFEASLMETERVRALYELALEQPLLDMPEILWKAYIDYEIENQESAAAIKLFERLLGQTQHIKVFMTYAKYIGSLGAHADARAVYQRAVDHAKTHSDSESRLTALRAWHAFELEVGDDASVKAVADQMPQRIKKRRMRRDASGNQLGWEEYYDYVWNDVKDRTQANLKFLEKARQWAAKQAAASSNPAPEPAPELAAEPAPES